VVAKTQYCAAVLVSRGGWCQVTVNLLRPSNLSRILDHAWWRARAAGDGARMSFDLLCYADATC